MPTEFEIGVLTGLLVGEGSFGGDGRQPQVALRMHVRHQALFDWLSSAFPGGKLYGPYHHGGRHYLQWMARGSYLKDELVPLLETRLSPGLDGHSFDRFEAMKKRYHSRLGLPAESEEGPLGWHTGPPGESVGTGTPQGGDPVAEFPGDKGGGG